MPVLNGVGQLKRSLAALEASDLDPADWDLLVVDDGSTDGTAELVRSRGHRLVEVPDGPKGPGVARNLGVTHALGTLVVFVDADVCVHSDVLTRFVELFEQRPALAAAFGTYDDHPTEPDFLSQYRNLYHRYTHLQGAGAAETFWAGCGAIRRAVFLDLGGFDVERFPRPQIEDIELGYRIRDAGWEIELDPAIEGTHLKRWSLTGMVRTDLLDRGVPWMRLLLESPRTDSLNIRLAERVRTGLVGLSCALLGLSLVLLEPGLALVALAPLGGLIASNLAVYRWFARRRGLLFAMGVIPLNVLLYFLSGLSVVVAVPLHLRGRAKRLSPQAGATSIFSEARAKRDSETEPLASSREIR
jgi:glycosyltransferase involved in cell wall biosynthesis